MDTEFTEIIRIMALTLCKSKSGRQGRLEDKEAGNNCQTDVMRSPPSAWLLLFPLQLMLLRSSIRDCKAVPAWCRWDNTGACGNSLQVASLKNPQPDTVVGIWTSILHQNTWGRATFSLGRGSIASTGSSPVPPTLHLHTPSEKMPPLAGVTSLINQSKPRGKRAGKSTHSVCTLGFIGNRKPTWSNSSSERAGTPEKRNHVPLLVPSH